MSRAPSTSAQPSASDEKDRVARGHVGRRESRGASMSRPCGTGSAVGERRPADGAQIEIHLEVALDAERARDGARGLDLARMPLAVADGQREQREALRLGDRARRCTSRGRRSAARPRDRRRLIRRLASSATRCTCAAAAAAAPAADRPASIRTASSDRGRRAPATAAPRPRATARSWRAITSRANS